MPEPPPNTLCHTVYHDDDYFRDFAAFEPWFDRQMKIRKLDDVFKAGIDAGRNPWAWAEHVEQQQTLFKNSNEH